ncbi:unnamed protein product [Mytilus edulis]|uniref:EGF-like domain-containing protein n=1 Tax=Mytilus edulis TaxID=6550 RepID=A0A8S3TYL9_MYTED|nr:unnamed protein product [Mytilus edulis]
MLKLSAQWRPKKTIEDLLTMFPHESMPLGHRRKIEAAVKNLKTATSTKPYDNFSNNKEPCRGNEEIGSLSKIQGKQVDKLRELNDKLGKAVAAQKEIEKFIPLPEPEGPYKTQICSICHVRGHKSDGNKDRSHCMKEPCTSWEYCGRRDKHKPENQQIIESERDQLRQELKNIRQQKKESASSINVQEYVHQIQELKDQVIEKDKTVKMVQDLYFMRSTEFTDEIETLKNEKSDLHSKLQSQDNSFLLSCLLYIPCEAAVENIPCTSINSSISSCDLYGNAVCGDTSTCRCRDNYYDDVEVQTCRQKINIDAPCSNTGSCKDPLSTCIQVTGRAYQCTCNSGYYNNAGTCSIKLESGVTCTRDNDATECVSNAMCKSVSSSLKCTCNTGYYDDNFDNHGGLCRAEIALGGICTVSGSAIECVPYSTCMSVGSDLKCQCSLGYYDNDVNPAAGTCVPELQSGVRCTRDNDAT